MSQKWRPLQRASLRGVTEADIEATLSKIPGESREGVKAALDHEAENCEYWINDLYQVQVRPLEDDNGNVAAKHLNIRRRDGRPIFRDWRHFQWIKNQLVGEECEGLEIYPAESRLSDTSNKYHLFVYTDPAYRIPFGMQNRDVMDDTGTRKPGFRQRKF